MIHSTLGIARLGNYARISLSSKRVVVLRSLSADGRAKTFLDVYRESLGFTP